MIIIRLLLLVTILSTVYSNLLTKAYLLRKVYKRYSSRIISTSATTSSTTNSINDDIKYIVQRNTMSQTQLFSSNDNDNNISNNNDDNVISKYFVPIFISIWAIGYSLLALVETTSGGIGDLGGILGVGLVLVLFFGLLGITAFESFKDDKRYDN